MRRTLLLVLAVAAAPVAAAETQAQRTEAAGLRFSVPADWTRVPAPSDMRAAQFRVPHTGNDAEDGELVLFFFGRGQGGSADQNVARWTGQFTQPDGKPSTGAGGGEIPPVHALKQTSVDVGGTYKPAPMGGAGAADQPGWRPVGAVGGGEGGAS